MARRFFRSTIQELEVAFKNHCADVPFLRDILDELSHRKTDRAAKLRVAVRTQLEKLTSVDEVPLPPYPSRPPDQPKSTNDSPEKSDKSPVTPSTSIMPQEEKSQGDPLSPLTNQPEKILSAWIALEVLSPPAYLRPEELAGGDRRAVAMLDEPALPWERGEKSRPNNRLYYQIVLGSIRMEPALESLIKRFGDNRIERSPTKGKAVLAVVLVDQRGCLVESPSVAVSSFGWGITTVLRGELIDLARWPQVEKQLIEGLEKRLFHLLHMDTDREDDEGRPLTRDVLFSIYQQLVENLELPHELVEPPQFAIRSYEYFKNQNPPEPLILNSLFLNDLSLGQRLFASGKAPENLKRYLGQLQPDQRRDLLGDRKALEEAVAPAKTQFARWPAPGRHPLVLLQQAAVNLAFSETGNGGLLGINGPPGTGKTTLLRDIVAGIVTARAEEMTKLDDPEKAFSHSGQKLKAGEGWLHLYRLNDNMRGFEMIVASSNNKAVENVSAELPSLDAIAGDADALRYFKTASDSIHESDTWGLIAAVLGNAQNRSRFKRTFWWDENVGMNAYLTAAAGSVRQIAENNAETGRTEYRLPKIVIEEKPPSNHEEALKRWRRAQRRFLDVLSKSKRWQKRLEGLRADLANLSKIRKAVEAATMQREATIAREHNTSIKLQKACDDQAAATTQLNQVAAQIREHERMKPGLCARLFRTSKARSWKQYSKSLHAMCNNAKCRLGELSNEVAGLGGELHSAKEETRKAETDLKTALASCEEVEKRLSDARDRDNICLVDDAFFVQEHWQKHKATPWLPVEAQRDRDDVFIAAIELHRAFIDAAAKPLRHNLGVLMNVLSGQALTNDKQLLLSDLWATLFLMVPLVSTTFASIGRMLGSLPPETFGWLLVDEAGQALPQAAIGALIRTRKAIIVGDPVQIEPVVLLPETVTHAICRRFAVDPDRFAAPTASTQTLADAASTYMSEFQTKMGSRPAGVPLLVHRRCSEPMFSIANAVAYAGLMVSAKSTKPSPIRDVLGPSTWIHVEGSSEDKWCADEGAEVIKLLSQLAKSRVEPDLYIVTPFVIVAERLRQLVRHSGLLDGWIVGKDGWKWTSERIGTIHTVQGREAEAVIFVLGAPLLTQIGARNWAGGRPNLLNVAVTRAKEVLYVIGNRNLWRDAGVFQELDRRLPS